jgi:hypothetical protein
VTFAAVYSGLYRFSKLVKSTPVARPTGPTVSKTNESSSVFSRLRGAKPSSTRGRVGATNIQTRLGKTIGGGVKKRGNKTGPTAMQGIERQRKAGNGRVGKGAIGGKRQTGKSTATIGGKRQTGKSTATLGKSKQPQKDKKDKKDKKVVNKKPTAEDLDKALDAYMMKDPKTAQAKLDAELTSYMDEAGDILMDETL